MAGGKKRIWTAEHTGRETRDTKDVEAENPAPEKNYIICPNCRSWSARYLHLEIYLVAKIAI